MLLAHGFAEKTRMLFLPKHYNKILEIDSNHCYQNKAITIYCTDVIPGIYSSSQTEKLNKKATFFLLNSCVEQLTCIPLLKLL